MDARVNVLDQIAYVRRYVLTDGEAAGLRVVEINNGSIRLLLNESKALDIMQLWHDGTNISYLSKNAFTKRETSFVKRFEGGMLYTCGIDVIGGVEGYEDHGSLHNIPATVTRCEAANGRLTVEGTIRDGELFGKNLVLKRRITTDILSESVTLEDTLVNEGYRAERYGILYHTNVGYPMLDDGATIEADIAEIVPRTEWAKKNIGDALRMTAPEPLREETCYYLGLSSPKLALVNRRLGKRLTLEYSGDTLPVFIEWKSMASGEYALGLEPSMSKLDDDYRACTIESGEAVRFSLRLSVTRLHDDNK